MSPAFEESSGNVFLDIGFSPKEAEHLRARSELMARIIKTIRQKRLTQTQAARLFGVTQPRISDVMRGRIDRFSVDGLMQMLAHAGMPVRFAPAA
jgi:predicted XRE-type DNA-binding protein